MCYEVTGARMGKDDVFQTRSKAVVIITGVRKSGKVTAEVLKTSKKTANEFPVGSKFTYKSDIGHVLCKGEDEDGEECKLHPMDAVEYLAEGLASLNNPLGWSPFSIRETDRILARRQKWVDALESGEFQQDRGKLYNIIGEFYGKKTYGYCCLGVADEVCKLKTLGNTELNRDGLERLGLTDEQQQVIITLNDSDRKSFKNIARVIKKMPVLIEKV